MLVLNDAARQESIAYLDARFGVSPTRFADAVFFEPSPGEIWIASEQASLGGMPHSRRPPGLRALRRTPNGLKPTSAFLVSLGPSVAASRLALDCDSLRQLLLGRRIPCRHDDGYVAIAFDESVVGCGSVSDGNVHCLIPTGRRRELLDVLGT